MENVIWGLIGVFVGSIVTGLITYLTTRLQIDSKKREEQLGRLMKTREYYLIPLRETIAEWVRYSYLTMVRIVIIKEKGLANTNFELYKKLYDDLMSISGKESDLLLKLDILLLQVSDTNLYREIELFKEQTQQANLTIVPMIALLRDAKDKIQLEKIVELKKQVDDTNEKIHKLLIPINQRIEILLSGR